MPYKPKRVCNRCGKAVLGRCDCRPIKRQEYRPDATKRGYDRNWKKARAAWLANHPLCVACIAQGMTVAATVVDHVIPHKGDKELFWKEGNWQSLCTRCHNAKTRAGL